MRIGLKSLLQTAILSLLTIIVCPVLCSAQDLDNGYSFPASDFAGTYQNQIWWALSSDFSLNHQVDRPEVKQQIHWFVEHQAYLDQILTQSAPYIYYIFQQVKKKNLPGELVLLPIIESDYDPFAYSNVGAAGLWQLMPGTANGYGLKEDWWYDGRRDISASTNAALDYLLYLNSFFNNNWTLAIAAYNSGEGTVQQAIDYNARRDRGTDFWALPLPRQTQAYVPRLLALAAIIANPQEYGVSLPNIKNAPFIAIVQMHSQIDLAQAAKLAHIPLAELYQLNPGYNRWATAPDGPNHLILPITQVNLFKKDLAKLPKDKRVTWANYRVQSGDTLNLIARRYHTSVALLQQINHIKNTTIFPGQDLLIPLDAKALAHYNLTNELRFASQQQLNLGPKRLVYKVKPGDSLWLIAHKFGLKESQIRFWNRLKNSTSLRVFQHLVLWLPRHTHIPDSISAQRSHNGPSAPRKYQVHNGDTLSTIAERYHVSVKDIRKMNHLATNEITVGQNLTIPW